MQRVESPSVTEGICVPGDDHVLVRRFELACVAGPDRGKTFSSTGLRTVIGSADGVSVHLADRTVSRFHCEINLSEGRALLTDLGSRNGTFINNVLVVQAVLSSGSILTVGKTELRFDLGTQHVKLALSRSDRFGMLVGRSTAMRAVFAALEQAADSNATLLLEGETGTGKEIVAESLHRASARAEKPFVVVDCGAIPSELLESELFGHEKGAFTGAASERDGAFQLAHGGTIFLDEIGELPLELQPKLLRALESRTVKRVGGARYTDLDVRVIAATNRNLHKEVNTRRFRADLYYRLAVLEVRLPPLRERPDDLPVLIEEILRQLGAADRPEAAALRAPAFIAQLAAHPWPGNVRELRNHLERCLAQKRCAPLPTMTSTEDDHAPAVDLDRGLKESREAWSTAFEHRYVIGLLDRHGGNVTAAARAAGVDRSYFYRLLWKYGAR